MPMWFGANEAPMEKPNTASCTPRNAKPSPSGSSQNSRPQVNREPGVERSSGKKNTPREARISWPNGSAATRSRPLPTAYSLALGTWHAACVSADSWLAGGSGGQSGSTPRRPQLGTMLVQDLRWAFTRPFSWLVGLGVNLVLSLLYLLWVPLAGGTHPDWAILVGTYFAVFVLADVTSTNVIGVDAERTRSRLLRGVPLREVLLVKDLVLLLVVGLPTLIATGAITTCVEPEHRLVITLPGVLYPVFTWLGVGNLVSVLFPYDPLPLRLRWRQRRSVARTAYWLFCLGLPYALCLAVNELKRVPRLVTRAFALPSGDGVRGVQLLVLGLLAWALGTSAALVVARQRKTRFIDVA